MRLPPLLLGGLLTAAAALPAAGQASEAAHRRVYDKAAPAVVAVRALAPLGERSGSGVVLTADGLVLTSYAVCPEGSKRIRVWTRGPRLHEAEFVGGSRKDEIALLRIKPKEPLAVIELGSSAPLRVGQASYTLGNAANSIILDDQPSFNVGIVSALYRLPEDRAGGAYVGNVIETTAAVNVGMEGAPCLDPAGRMVGLVTLNYSPSRFLGAAIPMDELRPVLERLRAGAAPLADDPAPAGEGSLGARFRDENGRVVLDAVDKDGPADRAGLQKGDVVLDIAGRPVKDAAEAAARLRGLEAGTVVPLRVDLAGKPEEVQITLEKRK
jgi:S1-C subfamily serine protease